MNKTNLNDEQTRMVVGSLMVLALVAIAATLIVVFCGLFVLGIPITATIRIVLMRFDTTRKVGDLLAGKLPA